jgi:CBS-domain-containing membrane protein
MSENYTALPYHNLSSGTTYQRPPQRLPERVTADSPATDVMTDFSKVSAITMGPCATLEAAEQRMIASGVRMLLVTDQSNSILGIITATDLQGDRPVKYLEVLYMVDVENARVGHIVETMKRVGRQHALVIDLNEDKQQIVRGIFSTKQISKQLGINIDPTEVAKTFAELEAALTA